MFIDANGVAWHPSTHLAFDQFSQQTPMTSRFALTGARTEERDRLTIVDSSGELFDSIDLLFHLFEIELSIAIPEQLRTDFSLEPLDEISARRELGYPLIPRFVRFGNPARTKPGDENPRAVVRQRFIIPSAGADFGHRGIVFVGGTQRVRIFVFATSIQLRSIHR